MTTPRPHTPLEATLEVNLILSVSLGDSNQLCDVFWIDFIETFIDYNLMTVLNQSGIVLLDIFSNSLMKTVVTHPPWFVVRLFLHMAPIEDDSFQGSYFLESIFVVQHFMVFFLKLLRIDRSITN